MSRDEVYRGREEWAASAFQATKATEKANKLEEILRKATEMFDKLTKQAIAVSLISLTNGRFSVWSSLRDASHLHRHTAV